jgi:hypothetical protein
LYLRGKSVLKKWGFYLVVDWKIDLSHQHYLCHWGHSSQFLAIVGTFPVFYSFWISTPALMWEISANNVVSPFNSTDPSHLKPISYSWRAEMCKPISLKWVQSVEALLWRVCLNYTASADSSSSSGEHFSDFHCLEKGPHWT